LHGPDRRSLRLPAPSRNRRPIRRVLRLSRTPDTSCHLTAKSSFPLPHFVCGSVFYLQRFKRPHKIIFLPPLPFSLPVSALQAQKISFLSGKIYLRRR